jgi:hypothetical protein
MFTRGYLSRSILDNLATDIPLDQKVMAKNDKIYHILSIYKIYGHIWPYMAIKYMYINRYHDKLLRVQVTNHRFQLKFYCSAQTVVKNEYY